MLCLCYLSLVRGTPDYTHGPVRLATHVVIEAANDIEAADVLRKAAAAKRVPKTHYTPANIALNPVGKYHPRLISYYDSPQGGHVWVIQPTAGGASFYIFTPKQYADMVSAIHQHFMDLIYEQAAVLESNGSELKLRLDISGDVCSALCGILAPGFTMHYAESTTRIHPETIRIIEEALKKDPFIQERLNEWKNTTGKKPKEDWSRPQRPHSYDQSTSREESKEVPKPNFPKENYTRQSTQNKPLPTQAAPLPEAYSFEAPCDDEESKIAKELRQKAKRAARKALLFVTKQTSQQKEVLKEEQLARQEFEKSVQLILANMAKQELLERLKLWDKKFDTIHGSMLNEENQARLVLRGKFICDLFRIEKIEKGEQAQRLQKLREDFENIQKQARQSLLDESLTKRQEIEKVYDESIRYIYHKMNQYGQEERLERQKVIEEYDEINRQIQEGLRDLIPETDPMLILWPDGWGLPHEDAFTDKQIIIDKAYQLICALNNKIYRAPEFLRFIYQTNIQKIKKAEEMLATQIDAYTKAIDVHEIPLNLSEEETLKFDRAKFESLPTREQKIIYLHTQMKSLKAYWRQSSPPNNVYPRAWRFRVTFNILAIDTAFKGLVIKFNLADLLCTLSDIQLHSLRSSKEIQDIGTYLKVDPAQYTNIEEFQAAWRKAYKLKALVLHPDKNPGGNAEMRVLNNYKDALEKLTEYAHLYGAQW